MQPSVLLRKNKRKSRPRAYILLRVIQGCPEDVVRILSRHRGVVTVDQLEGPPDILMVMEAQDRPKLAKAVMRALTSIDNMTDGVDVLPVRDNTFVFVKG